MEPRTQLNPGSKPIRNMLLNLVQNLGLEKGLNGVPKCVLNAIYKL